jgi:hypothetical protein
MLIFFKIITIVRSTKNKRLRSSVFAYNRTVIIGTGTEQDIKNKVK